MNNWLPSMEGRAIWRVRNNTSKTLKTKFALKSILEAGANFDVLIDMQDRRIRNLITPEKFVAPVFSFNRPIAKRTGHILWPLPHYQDIDGEEFLGRIDPNHVPWQDKKDIATWRGGPGNRGIPPSGRNTIRMRPLLQKFRAGEINEDEARRCLHSMPRYRFVSTWINDPRFDIGYTNSDGFLLADEPFLNLLERPKMTRRQFQDYKYIFVLPGADVGSSFYWTMNSGSVGLVVDCDFESFASHHFKPWEHYVPIRRDQANLDRQLRWCMSHQNECRAIAERAKEKCKFLADQDLRDNICEGIISELRIRLAHGDIGRVKQ
ncbi:MAG: glycosyl transferase family 90 [Litoreibacter sp.]